MDHRCWSFRHFYLFFLELNLCCWWLLVSFFLFWEVEYWVLWIVVGSMFPSFVALKPFVNPFSCTFWYVYSLWMAGGLISLVYSPSKFTRWVDPFVFFTHSPMQQGSFGDLPISWQPIPTAAKTRGENARLLYRRLVCWRLRGRSLIYNTLVAYLAMQQTIVWATGEYAFGSSIFANILLDSRPTEHSLLGFFFQKGQLLQKFRWCLFNPCSLKRNFVLEEVRSIFQQTFAQSVRTPMKEMWKWFNTPVNTQFKPWKRPNRRGPGLTSSPTSYLLRFICLGTWPEPPETQVSPPPTSCSKSTWNGCAVRWEALAAAEEERGLSERKWDERVP